MGGKEYMLAYFFFIFLEIMEFIKQMTDNFFQLIFRFIWFLVLSQIIQRIIIDYHLTEIYLRIKKLFYQNPIVLVHFIEEIKNYLSQSSFIAPLFLNKKDSNNSVDSKVELIPQITCINIKQLILKSQVKRMSSKIKSVLNSYLKQNKRISVPLSIALHLLIESKNPVAEFGKVIKKSSQPLKLFRALILLHECYLNNILQYQQATQLLCEIKKGINNKINSKLDQIISKQVLGPYVLYLQKCLHVQTQQAYGSDMSAEQILYQYLNLLKLGLSMVDILYTFGRYFKQIYTFIIDYNVLVGKDFAQLYESKIKATLKKNKRLWDEQMKLELQKIHEKMYVVYYNCYYYKFLKFYIPKWIDTDYNRQRNLSLPVKRQRNQSKTPIKQNQSSLFTKQRIKITQMSISTIFTQTKASPGQFSTKMANSTLIIPREKRLRDQNLSLCPSNVSQFTCDVIEKNDQYVIDQTQSQSQNQKQNQQNNKNQRQNPYNLLASMQRVIQLIDQNIEVTLNINKK